VTTAYAELWWNFGLFGIGIGLMLSPITSTVLSAVPPTRGGLASSVVNTSRQLGSVLGIAVLGALVEHQEASNLASQLRALHVPARISETVANSIATAGANAGAAASHHGGGLPITGAALRQVIGEAFTDAVHPSLVTCGVALLCVAVLAAVLLGRGGHLTTQDTPSPERALESPSVSGTARITHPASAGRK
jgi:hypothetical protein